MIILVKTAQLVIPFKAVKALSLTLMLINADSASNNLQNYLQLTNWLQIYQLYILE